MSTILEALGRMGKATAREIAAKIKIEPLDALALLREYEEAGKVCQVNGSWQFPVDADARASRPPRARPNPKSKPRKSPEAARVEPVGAVESTQGVAVSPVADAVKSADIQFVESIPAITERAVTMSVPTPTELAREIRRTKSRLARLEKCRDAARELKRHRNLFNV